MADIFVSYSRADEARVGMLVRALEAHGVSVWWDRSLEQGANFGAMIRQEIAAAKAVVVCWSDAASKSQWVLDEADEAKHLGKYVGCQIGVGRAAMGFNTLNNANLATWEGAADDMQLLMLLADLGRKIDRPDIAERADVQRRMLAETDAKARAAEEAERVRARQEEEARERKAEEHQRRLHERAILWWRISYWALNLSLITVAFWYVIQLTAQGSNATANGNLSVAMFLAAACVVVAWLIFKAFRPKNFRRSYVLATGVAWIFPALAIIGALSRA